MSAVYGWLFIVIFLAAAFHFYFRPVFNSNQFLYSFLALIVLSLLFFKSSLAIGYWLVASGLFVGFLFFLLLGIKNLILSHRQTLYYFLHGVLFLVILIFFFYSQFSSFFIKYILVFFGIYALLKEFLDFFAGEKASSRKINLVVLSGAFLAIQFIWLTGLLPFGFVNAAVFVLLIIFILEDFILHHFSGTISRKIVLRNTTAFLVLCLVIFGMANWGI